MHGVEKNTLFDNNHPLCWFEHEVLSTMGHNKVKAVQNKTSKVERTGLWVLLNETCLAYLSNSATPEHYY